MGFLGFVSQKELDAANQRIKELEETLYPEKAQVEQLNGQIADLKAQEKEVMVRLTFLREEDKDLQERISEAKKNIIELDDEILYQSYNLFKPKYDFATSEEYKEELENIRARQKQMIKDKSAVSYFDNWTVDGSKTAGRKMTNDNIKMILRCFNSDCENAIDRVKVSNIDSSKARIEKSYTSLNKLNETNKVSITPEFLQLKYDELNLAIEYAWKKQEEKEEQKRIRQEMREQAKLEKELAEARKNIEKEQTHYENALQKLQAQLESESSQEKKEDLLQKETEIKEQLSKIHKSLEDVDYRTANQKAGYVYVISNIGAFGENVYKIGMTRRLDPMERVDELGDASVPFNFDVHAMIFSEDAPKLEAALHKAFEDRKLNMVNTRREFFHVTLEEIEQVVKENYDKTVEFIKTPPAEQYRLSKAMLEQASNNNAK